MDNPAVRSVRRPQFCEFPAATGAPLCAKPATQTVCIIFDDDGKSQATLMLCDECAKYVERETRFNKGVTNQFGSAEW